MQKIITNDSQNNKYHEQTGSFAANNSSHLPANQKNSAIRPIAQLTLKPHEQKHASLGVFTDQNPPKGFTVELNPEPDPKDSVTTLITSLARGRQQELVLQIANFGSRATTATVYDYQNS